MSHLEPPEVRDPASEKLLVVGIGVSAADLSALERLFGTLAPGTGMAFVVVQHLSPEFKSLLKELLGPNTELAVETAVDRVPVMPDTVYVLPPGKQMIIADGRLLLADRGHDGETRSPFDRVSVVPLHAEGQLGGCAVSFTQSDHPSVRETPSVQRADSSQRQPLIALQQELDQTRVELRAALENSDASNRAMQLAHEKLKAANEELQATREALRSANEKLFSVNTEYPSTIAELTELSNDIENLLLTADVQTLLLDRELRVRKFTPKIAEIFQLVGDDVRRPIDSFAHHLLCDDLGERIREVLAQETVVQQEVRSRAGDSFLMRILPYRAGTETSGVVLTLTDISGLIESQRQTLRMAQRLERVIAATTDGLWDWPDVEVDEMWWSPACYRMLGYEPGEFPATFKEWLKRIHPVDRKLITNPKVSTSGRCYVDFHQGFEFRMRHKSGEYRWFRQHPLVDHDEQCHPVHMTGSVRDIHLSKRAELQAENEIQQWDSFLAMLSHELRNPLAAVFGALELLDDGEANAGGSDRDLDAGELFAVIRRQVDQMAHRLDDLLEVARIQQNKSPFKKSKVDLASLSQEVLIWVQPQIEAKHQNLHVSVPDRPVVAVVDPARFADTQRILLENASKHSAEYEDIHYELTVEEDHVVIAVRDQGRGIADDALESVFDPFSLFDVSDGEVGLSMVRSIIQAHGGSIQADSEGLDKGTVFTIRLPLINAAESAGEDSVAERKASSRHSGRLLIVEDNVDVARMLDRAMSRAGFEVGCAIDGYEALELFDELRPAVAVIDIGLPGMNGYELARSLRKRPGGDSVFLIAVTGYGMACDRAESEASGFDRHLVKPVNNDHLLSVIEGFFAARSKK